MERTPGKGAASAPRRREGDAIAIPGDYQTRAIESPYAVQRFWHRAKLRLIDRVLPARPGARVADAGCGSGVIAAHLAQTAGMVVGVDPNADAIRHAAATYGGDRLRFVCGSFDALRQEAPLDQIYCLEVLEHLYEEQAVDTLRLFAEVGSPGVQLLVTTPNAWSAWPAIEWTLDRLQLVPMLREAQHLTAFTRGRLARALERAGWRVTDLGTFNGVAPFVAPLSERLARLVERGEFAVRRVAPWNLLYCRAERPA